MMSFWSVGLNWKSIRKQLGSVLKVIKSPQRIFIVIDDRVDPTLLIVENLIESKAYKNLSCNDLTLDLP